MLKTVAPLAGAWIEIINAFYYVPGVCVAPLAGAWIEILVLNWETSIALSRSPRGSVD